MRVVIAAPGARRLAAALFALAGCAPTIGDPPPAVDEIALVADNGIFLDNGLKLTNGADAGNGIKLTNGFDLSNGIDLANGIKLTNGANTIEPPPGSDLERWIDVDPTMRLRIIRYQVECALSAGTAVDVIYREQSFTFVGQVGLGPSWLEGLMTVTEQERVSACLLARINARGDLLRIVLVGPYPGLDTLSDEDRDGYPTREATFVGNLYQDVPSAQVVNSSCGSRACKADLLQGTCDCGVLEMDLSYCEGPEGAAYDTRCCFITGTTLWHTPIAECNYLNPITTYVAQENPGGACSADVDCIYHNCESGVCGDAGAECAWEHMCVDGLGCGADDQCGGSGARCTDSSDCIHDNCQGGVCGDMGAPCSTGAECWSSYCAGSTCRACRRDRDCPGGTFCASWNGHCLK